MYAKDTMNNAHVYCVILAGGIGERLWPLSLQNKPKQLLEIQGNQTLLDQAIDRVAQIISQHNIFISTTEQHKKTMLNLFGDRIGDVITEPGLRNTGPAILLSCLQIYKKDPQAIILFLPADPFIPQKDNLKFAQYLEHAIDFASQHHRITLLGVKPNFAATGYGYIEFDATAQEYPSPIKKFHEKPSQSTAQQYLDSESMLWNIGMFCAKASVFIDEYKKVAPEIYQGIIDYQAGIMPYQSIKADSIDVAIMEKSNCTSVLPVDFAWCDVGSLEIFLSIKDMFGSLNTKVIQTESHHNLVNVPNKLVALIGVSDLCVVETDKVLLITKRQDTQKVRDIVKLVKQQGFTQYL